MKVLPVLGCLPLAAVVALGCPSRKTPPKVQPAPTQVAPAAPTGPPGGVGAGVPLTDTPLNLTMDSDRDGIVDAYDNCATVANPTQDDGNGDGFGDVCQPVFTLHVRIDFPRPNEKHRAGKPIDVDVAAVGEALFPERDGSYRTGGATDVVVRATYAAIAKVELYANGAKIGEALGDETDVSLDEDQEDGVQPLASADYSVFPTFVWKTPRPGTYVLEARATDVTGVSVSSAPVTTTVVAPEDWPNLSVRIESPKPDQQLSGEGIEFEVSAYSEKGYIAKVEFYVDDMRIGETEGNRNRHICPWRWPGPGTYVLTAVATDLTGATATSEPLTVTVVPDPER